MAGLQKVTDHGVCNLLKHMDRSQPHNSNADIDPARTPLNYKLSPDRAPLTDYQYYKRLRDDCFVFNRNDVKTVACWCITMPQMPNKTEAEIAKLEEVFFSSCYDFLNNRYGYGTDKLVINCSVHKDEAGESHMHYAFVPVVPDDNPRHEQVAKVCMNDVVDLRDMKTFHLDLQKHLDKTGYNFPVHTGITKASGGSRTVKQLKAETQRERQLRERLIEANQRIQELERPAPIQFGQAGEREERQPRFGRR